jgi:hypothetical protein
MVLQTLFETNNQANNVEVNHIMQSDYNHYSFNVNQIFERNSQFGSIKLGLIAISMQVQKHIFGRGSLPSQEFHRLEVVPLS